MNAIETKGLTKQYKDVTAVDSLDLAVASGELFALLGVNGAGKTTTIKMLSCLTAPTSGTVSVNGHDVTSDSAAVKREIAISPQESAVAPGLTAAENLELMCGVHGFDKAKSKAKIAEMLTEDEADILRRGRNAHGISVPRSATPADYRKATGFECLFGYLYLCGKTERLQELFAVIWQSNPQGTNI